LFTGGTAPSTVDRVSAGLAEGMIYAMRAVTGSTNDRVGFFQMLESEIAIGLAGNNVSLSVQLKRTGATLINAEFAIWTTTATADTEASDVASGAGGSWTSTIAAGANWTETAAQSVTLTNDFQSVVLENITIPASTTNIIVGAYTSDTATDTGVNFFAGNFQMEYGRAVTEFQHLPKGIELYRCYEYLYVISADSATSILGQATNINATAGQMRVQFPVRMSGVPSITTPGSDALLDVTNWAGSGSNAPSFTGSDQVDNDQAFLGFTTTGMSAGGDESLLIQKDGSSTAQYIIIFSNEV
jgi:hypothetical protein